MKLESTAATRSVALLFTLSVSWLTPDLAFAQASPFMTGATALQTNILAWLTPVAVILVMVLGAMAMANRMLKSLAARIVFAPKDFPDAREISDELGFTTVTVRTVSKPIGVTLDGRGQRSRSHSISEQRRALLLPQEVKELGTEEAIVFYEGLRPIRCRKIRYFTERRFRKRLLPAPKSPTPKGRLPPSVAVSPPEPVRAEPVAGERPPDASSIAVLAPKKEEIVMRDATVEDVDRIESLTLEDFETDFSKVQIPDREGPLSDGEMKVAVDTFLGSLERG
jgi:type IV secretion system protein VirD4